MALAEARLTSLNLTSLTYNHSAIFDRAAFAAAPSLPLSPQPPPSARVCCVGFRFCEVSLFRGKDYRPSMQVVCKSFYVSSYVKDFLGIAAKLQRELSLTFPCCTRHRRSSEATSFKN